MNKLLEKIKKSSTIKETSVISKSKVYNEKDMIDTGIPALNLALSSKIDGGLSPGVLILAGESRNFKSGTALLMAAAYQKKYQEGVILFYDSEFGTPPQYFKNFDIDMERVIHTPITDIEELKHDLMQQLRNIERGDRVCIVIDSIGNLASKKEIDDAIDGRTVADFSRSKSFKSLFRMITPHLSLKDVPLIAVAHVYKEMGMFPKTIVSGGTAIMLSGDNVWIITRRQEKDKDKKIKGYNFTINVEKSRYVREKSKIPIVVNYETGVNKWSGLFDMALETEYIKKVGPNKYSIIDPETNLIDKDVTYSQEELAENDEVWEMILEKTDFKETLHQRYAMEGTGSSIELEEEEEE